MKDKLKAILGECFSLVMILWTCLIGIWIFGVVIEIGSLFILSSLHIIREHNFNIPRFSPVMFNGVFSFNWIVIAFLWRLTLDVATMYRIANKFKLKWYDFLDGEKWIGSRTWSRDDSFLVRVLQHFFVGIPEAPKSKDDNT